MDKGSRSDLPRARPVSSKDQYRVDVQTTRRWVAAAEVAEMLSVTRREVYYLIEAGELPGIKLGRAVRIPLDALEQWIADKETEAKELRSAYGPTTRLG